MDEETIGDEKMPFIRLCNKCGKVIKRWGKFAKIEIRIIGERGNCPERAPYPHSIKLGEYCEECGRINWKGFLREYKERRKS